MVPALRCIATAEGLSVDAPAVCDALPQQPVPFVVADDGHLRGIVAAWRLAGSGRVIPGLRMRVGGRELVALGPGWAGFRQLARLANGLEHPADPAEVAALGLAVADARSGRILAGAPEPAQLAPDAPDAGPPPAWAAEWALPAEPPPVRACPPGLDPAAAPTLLAARCERRLEALQRAGAIGDPAPYRERLQAELDRIARAGFAPLFCLLDTLLGWCRAEGVLIGPGRGSVGCSLVAWLLGATRVDPLRHDLPMERFLAPGRLPDIDIDIDARARSDAMRFLLERYGAHAARPAVCGRWTLRAAAEAAAREAGFDTEGWLERIPAGDDVTLERALRDPQLLRRRRRDRRLAEVLREAERRRGRPARLTTHPSGVVVLDQPVADWGRRLEGIVEYDPDDLDALALPKLDLLSSRALSQVALAVTFANRLRSAAGAAPLPPDGCLPVDEAVAAALAEGRTGGVPHLGAPGLQALARSLCPTSLGAVADLLALHRPAPLRIGLPDRYAAGEAGWPDPVAAVLASTRGVLLYQEQLLAIARAAGLDTRAADAARRAMLAADAGAGAEPLEALRAAVERRWGRDVAARLGLERPGGYLFCRAHALGYAQLAVDALWLWCHYPAAMAAAGIELARGREERIAQADAARAHGARLLPPDPNVSATGCEVLDARTARVGLRHADGLGRAGAEAVVAARDRRGRLERPSEVLAIEKAPPRGRARIARSLAVTPQRRLEVHDRADTGTGHLAGALVAALGDAIARAGLRGGTHERLLAARVDRIVCQRTRAGHEYALVTVRGPRGSAKLVAYPETWARCRSLLVRGRVVVARAVARRSHAGALTWRIVDVRPPWRWLADRHMGITVVSETACQPLVAWLAAQPAGPVRFTLELAGERRVRAVLPEPDAVPPAPAGGPVTVRVDPATEIAGEAVAVTSEDVP